MRLLLHNAAVCHLAYATDAVADVHHILRRWFHTLMEAVQWQPLMSLCGATFTDDAEFWSRGYTQLIRSVAAVAHYDQMHKPGKVLPCKHRRCWFAA